MRITTDQKSCTWPSGIHNVRDGACTRCGAVKLVEKFEAILDLEQEVRATAASQAFAPAMTSDRAYAAKVSNAQAAKTRLFAAVDGLAPWEQAAFGEYRKNA